MSLGINKQCIECQKDFVLSSGEVEFYKMKKDEKGNPLKEPKRCRECRSKKKREKERINTERETEKRVEQILSGETFTL